jgi:hypothetical protein
LRQQILGDENPFPSEADCKDLDNRLDRFDLTRGTKTDLGPICRLLVARRASGRRPVAPCLNRDSPNPDWDPHLDDKYSLEIQNMVLSVRPLARRRIVPPERAGAVDVTVYGTFVLQRHFADNGRRVEFATYFCVADNPYRYVPYYYMLTIDEHLTEAGWVAQPPDVPILRQTAKFKHEDDQRLFLFVDLNGDRTKDIVIFRRANGAKSFTLAACLSNPKRSECVPVTSAPVTFDDIGAFTLTLAHGQTVVVQLAKFNDPPAGEWRFRLEGAHLALVSKEGSAAGPNR